MGFLDNSTNNIILDAVLTDEGRKALAKNDGSFSIVKFALGDDEVDYSLITKYGVAVGREKIEKNTPIFEAPTSATAGLRSLLISSPSLVSNIGYLNNTGTSVVSLDVISTKSSTIKISQDSAAGEKIPSDLTNQVYFVDLDNRFLTIRGKTPRYVSNKNFARYFINRNDIINSSNGSVFDQVIEVKSTVNTKTFDTYGTTTTSGIIRTFVTVTGRESGQSITVEVKINKSV